MSHFIDNIEDLKPNTRVAVYGTGAYGIAMAGYIQIIRPDIQLVCFLDSFNSGDLMNLPVYTPDSLKEISDDFDMILIGSDGFRNDIHKTLEKYGYSDYYDVWFYESMFYEPEEDILIPEKIDESESTLYAYYDLRISPYTFDVVSFMALAEFRRKTLNLKKLQIFIIKDESSDKWNWNIYNVIIPVSQFIPSVSGVTITKTNDFLNELIKNKPCFPINYTYEEPKTAYTLKMLTGTIRSAGYKPDVRATDKARQFINSWIEKKNLTGRPIVTITLRQSPGYPDRNSSLDDWLKFADYLIGKGYVPIILKDTYTVFDEHNKDIDKYITFDEVVMNIDLRLALYEAAYVNMGIANGPMALCIYSNHIPYLVHMKMNDAYYATLPRYLEEMGLPMHTQFPLAKKNQILRWSYDDTFNTIKQEFDEFVELNPFNE